MKQTRKLVVSFSNGQAVSLFTAPISTYTPVHGKPTPMLTKNATGVFSSELGN